MTPLTLETERLVLREFSADDFADVHAYGSDPEVTRYVSWGPNSESDTRDFLKRMVEEAERSPRTDYELAIAERATGRVVGGCGAMPRRLEYGEYEVGYCLHRDAWRQGIGSEAAGAIVGFAFEELDAHRLYALINPLNRGSRALIEKLGFRLEGHQRSDMLARGEWQDTLVYAQLNDEWQARSGAGTP